MTHARECAGKCPVRSVYSKAAGDCWSCWSARRKPPKAVPAALPCVHVGQEAGPKGWHVCEHPDEPLGAIVCSCRGCGPRCPGYAAARGTAPPAGAVVLDQGGSGIGDALLGLCAAEGLRRQDPRAPVTYRVSPAARPWVKLFAGWGDVGVHAAGHSERPTPGARQLNEGYTAELRSRGAEPRVGRYCRNAGAARAELPALAEPERLRELGRAYAGAVLLAPFSAFPDREYSLPGWLTAEGLLRAAGYRTVVLHSEPKRAELFRGEKLLGASPDRVAGAALNAACVVGGDSGMAHVAGLLGRPTVVLCGPTRGESVYGFYGPHVKYLAGPLSCSGCHWQSPHGRHCRGGCPSLDAITPDRILADVDAACLPALAGGRTLLCPAKLAVLRDRVRKTNGLAGDVAELGVYRGGSAKLIRHYARGGTLHLFDTFAGLPADDEGGAHRAGEFACGLAEVRAFVGEDGVSYHPGTFPLTAPAGLRLRFAHVDLDLYESTRAACEWLRKATVPGGVCCFDDYGWHKTPGVQRALHEAFPAHVERAGEYQAVVRF